MSGVGTNSTPILIGSAGAAPVSLDELAHRVAALWSTEPCVGDPERTRLLHELHQLDTDVDRLIVRREAGAAVHTAAVRSCLSRYLWLRENWGDQERVA